MELNPILQTQIHKISGGLKNIPENCVALLKEVSDLYDRNENHRQKLNHSIELQSNQIAALRNNITELNQSNIELDKFVYSVSHDLRAPLMSMLGVIEMTENETTETLTSAHMKMLQQSIHKLNSFIAEILDYSRNKRLDLNRETINFNDLLSDITTNLQYMNGASKLVEINFDVEEQGLFCSDRTRIGIVLSNLISNSIRYYNPKVEKPFVNIHVETDELQAQIDIEDNGVGISKEFHQRIFEMFYRVSEKSDGSGLGLYIVKEMVDKLKGDLQIESQPDKGTKFSIHIPNLFYQ